MKQAWSYYITQESYLKVGCISLLIGWFIWNLKVGMIFCLITLYFFKKSIWYNLTRDYINNLEKKKVFLNNEFEYLINSVIEVEGIPPEFYKTKKEKWKYEIEGIWIKPPRKIKKDGWEVFIGMTRASRGYSKLKILNISDQELEGIISNKKGLNSFINPDSIYFGGGTILNPDVFKKNSD